MTDEGNVLSIEGLTVDLPAWADRRHAVEDVSLALGHDEILCVDLPPWGERPRAVDDVSLELRHDEILCVVGESGSGKSVMARSILGLFPSRHVKPSGGRIVYRGEDLLTAPQARLRPVPLPR